MEDELQSSYAVADIDYHGQVDEPGEERSGNITRCPMAPVATLYCAGHDLGSQPHVDLRHLNTMMTQAMVSRVQGLFHVTTLDTIQSILREEVQSGRKVPVGFSRGNADIHMLTVPPQMQS